MTPVRNWPIIEIAGTQVSGLLALSDIRHHRQGNLYYAEYKRPETALGTFPFSSLFIFRDVEIECAV